MPVPPNGNCMETGAHLDPFERGEMPPCNPDLPQTCQVGDLAGKHGAITSMPFRTTYTDDFTAVSKHIPGTLLAAVVTDKKHLQTSDSLSFIGNLSVVVHFANLTRITCANLEPLITSQQGGNINSMDSLDAMFDAAYSALERLL